MRITKAQRITQVSVDFVRGQIVGDIDNSFATLQLRCMKSFLETEAVGFGYVYDNWSMHDLKKLADSIYAFLSEHEEGRKLLLVQGKYSVEVKP